MSRRYDTYKRAITKYFKSSPMTGEKVILKRIKDKSLLRDFVTFNISLYKDNPYHVPSLIDEELMTLDWDQNPAFEFCEAAYFLAYRGDQIVGRISGIINNRANETWNQNHARFGFLDFIDDDEVVDMLFEAVEDWARRRGCDFIHGPMGFTDLDREGLLIEGFDQLATITTNYNYPYYSDQLERRGYHKDQDWKEYKIYAPDEIPEKHRRIANLVREKYGLATKKFTKRKEVYPYAHRIFETLNASYAPLYGFATLTPAQIDYYVKMYIPMVRLDLVTLIVRESDDEVVGFGITIPNLSHAMKKAKGKLWPFGFLHILRALYSKPKVVDLLLIGIIPEYQNKGVNALIFEDLIPIIKNYGVEYVESNPELETNLSVQLQWSYFEKVHHKTRRAYIKEL